MHTTVPECRCAEPAERYRAVMARLLHFAEPHRVSFLEADDAPLGHSQVRVSTMYSGISAGTDLTWFRHTNLKLFREWDKEHNTFAEVDVSNGYSPAAHAELVAPGYEQVGRIIDV